MAFMGIFAFMAAIVGFIIVVLGLIGICMVIIGGTGIAMNKIYMKQAQVKKSVSKSLHNTSSIILGLVLILVPVGYVLYEIISEYLKYRLAAGV